MYFCQSSNVELNIYDDKNFITSPSDYQYWAKDKNQQLKSSIIDGCEKGIMFLWTMQNRLVVAGIMIKKIVKYFKIKVIYS